jgi:adenosylhomocysteine nucleosidase
MKRILVIMMAILCLCLAGCGDSSSSAGEADVIGIIGAMDSEVDSLKEDTSDKKSTVIAGMEFIEGTLRDKSVVIVKCGVGKVNAGICANTLINNYGCTRIINTGVAGSLNNDIDIGDIVVSVDAVQHDMDATALGFEKGEIPYTDMRVFLADESLRQVAVEAAKESAPGIKVFEGRICSGDQFVATREQKDSIIAEFDGMCTEMEGAAIAQACCLNNTPFVIIRAISDKEDGSQNVQFETFQAEAAKNCANIVEEMVERIAVETN